MTSTDFESEIPLLDNTILHSDASLQTDPADYVTKVDKSIDNSKKMCDKLTQYKFEHFFSENDHPNTSTTEPKKILKIKLPKRKKCKEKSINMDWSFTPFDVSFTVHEPPLNDSFGNLFDSANETNDPDQSFQINSEISSEEESYISEEETEITGRDNTNSFSDDIKLLVFWSCILPLLTFCRICFKRAKITKTCLRGTNVIVSLICRNNHETEWRSQPTVNKIASGNLILASSILFSGNTYARIKEMLDTAKIQLFSHTTFNKLQKTFLCPAINKVY